MFIDKEIFGTEFPDRISKNQLIAMCNKQNRKIQQLTAMLYVENPHHLLFKDIPKETLDFLKKLRKTYPKARWVAVARSLINWFKKKPVDATK